MTVSTPALPLDVQPGILAGRSVLVTGAGPHGVATARAFAAAGAFVALAGADDLALLRTTRAIEARGGRAIPLPGDVTDPDAVRRAVASVGESVRTLDFAVNTIGAVDGPRDIPEAACRAIYVAMSCELPAILEGRGGAIVNAAPTPLDRHQEEAHCIVGLTRAAALDNMANGVRVNAVVTRAGAAGDFAAAAVWLCSDRAADVTGSVVPPAAS
jgi:NAD(P)-dependent dehydrogenase (short-subunit alcohol dehydrogenase family)